MRPHQPTLSVVSDSVNLSQNGLIFVAEWFCPVTQQAGYRPQAKVDGIDIKKGQFGQIVLVGHP